MSNVSSVVLRRFAFPISEISIESLLREQLYDSHSTTETNSVSGLFIMSITYGLYKPM